MTTEQQQPQTTSSHPPEEVPKDEDKAIIPHPSSHDDHKALAIIVHTSMFTFSAFSFNFFLNLNSFI